MPLSGSAKDTYSYRDYLTWPDDERWEIIRGEAYAMTPAPSTAHQRLVGALYATLRTALRGHRCLPFVAPVDVVLSDQDVVQPDVLVVCDRSKVGAQAVKGAPDLVIEVLSPATGLKDRREKRALYEQSGVREFLLVDGEARTVERFHLGPDRAYGKPEVFGPADVMNLVSLEGVELVLGDVFEGDDPSGSTAT